MRGATYDDAAVKADIKFQSTRPMRGATLVIPHIGLRRHISIHAPLAGCDAGRTVLSPLRGISIHAPLAGCDLLSRSGPTP